MPGLSQSLWLSVKSWQAAATGAPQRPAFRAHLASLPTAATRPRPRSAVRGHLVQVIRARVVGSVPGQQGVRRLVSVAVSVGVSFAGLPACSARSKGSALSADRQPRRPAERKIADLDSV
jgi:hypothetical protein